MNDATAEVSSAFNRRLVIDRESPENMSRHLRGADLIVRSLAVAGVERLLTLSGNQIMPIFDATIDAGIELIHVRHEAAAVHMADAFGRLTGEPGVALLTAGPGHANALSAMYVAWAAESPLVVLSGHAPRSRLEQDAFQEMAQAQMAGHVAKASWTAGDATRLGHELARAVRTARSGRPGPVHVSLPVDLLEAEVDDSPQNLPHPDDCQPGMTLLDVQTAEEILSALSNAERPLILVGPAAMRAAAGGLVDELAAATGMPVIGMESPRGILDPSLGAFAEVLAEADLIVLLGKRLDFTLRFGEPPAIDGRCRFIHVDPEAHVLERTGEALAGTDRLLLAALADSLPTIERLIQVAATIGNRESAQRANGDWFERVQTAIRFRPAEWDRFTTTGTDEGLHPVAICRAVHDFLAESGTVGSVPDTGSVRDTDAGAVFISDGGEFGQWAQALIAAPSTDRRLVRLINGPSGSIGSAIPFALAARVVHPESRIVALLGDGTFGFHGMEFDTAVRHKLPFVAVVGNDACWNAEKQIQLRDYGPERLIGCDLLPTRYDEVARALGGHGEFVTTPEQLAPALERAFASDLPACVNVALGGQPAPVIRREKT